MRDCPPKSKASRRVLSHGRRHWCVGAAATVLGASAGTPLILAPPAQAQGPRPNAARPRQGIPRDHQDPVPPTLRIDLPQLRYPGDWQPYRDVMRSLGSALRLRTRIEAQAVPSIVELDDPKLFNTPFLYIAGRDSLPSLPPKALARLRRFIDIGGLVVFDDAGGGLGRSFAPSVQSWIDAAIPSAKLAPLPADHVLFRSFYLVSTPTGRTTHKKQAMAVLDEGRIKALLIPNDLGGALARGPDERYLMPCQPGGEVQREWALRFGVNILLYATCTDYKSDPAHVQTLLRRRSWR